MKRNVCTALARAVGARLRCLDIASHEEAIDAMLEDFPHGSGFDKGTTLDLDLSTGEKLVFTTAFHHMNDGGFYDGWTSHCVIVTPSLKVGFRLRITGRDRNGIKEHIAEAFNACLEREVGE